MDTRWKKMSVLSRKKILDIKLDSYEENKGLTKWATWIKNCSECSRENNGNRDSIENKLGELGNWKSNICTLSLRTETLSVCSASCFSIRTLSTSSNEAAICAGRAVLFHSLSGGAGDTKDNAIEKPLLKQDDKRWDYNLRGQEPRTGETDKWWELRSSPQAFTNDKLIFFYFGYKNNI